MITIRNLRPGQVSVITFDCYGTLIDWETGIWEAFRTAAANDGVRLDREEVVRAYPPGTSDTAGRYARGGACMKQLGFNLKKGAKF